VRREATVTQSPRPANGITLTEIRVERGTALVILICEPMLLLRCDRLKVRDLGPRATSPYAFGLSVRTAIH
jgi:hypothetical protein